MKPQNALVMFWLACSALLFLPPVSLLLRLLRVRRAVVAPLLPLALILCAGHMAYCAGARPSGYYLRVSEPNDVIYRNWQTGMEQPLRVGVVAESLANANGMLAVVRTDGRIEIYQGSRRIGKFYCKYPKLICWSGGNLLVSDGDKVYKCSPGSAKKSDTNFPCTLLKTVRFDSVHATIHADGDGAIVRTIAVPGTAAHAWRLPRIEPRDWLSVCGRYLVFASGSGRAEKLSELNLGTGAVRDVITDHRLLGYCRGSRPDEILVGFADVMREDGMVERTSVVAVNLKTLDLHQAFKTQDQIELSCLSDDGTAVLGIRSVQAHGAGQLVAIRFDGARVKVLREHVYEMYRADP